MKTMIASVLFLIFKHVFDEWKRTQYFFLLTNRNRNYESRKYSFFQHFVTFFCVTKNIFLKRYLCLWNSSFNSWRRKSMTLKTSDENYMESNDLYSTCYKEYDAYKIISRRGWMAGYSSSSFSFYQIIIGQSYNKAVLLGSRWRKSEVYISIDKLTYTKIFFYVALARQSFVPYIL